jgi:ribosome-associated protein
MVKRRDVIDTKKKISIICNAADERKAEDIVVMEMKDKSSMGDYFIIMSAPSTVRAKAIVDNIETAMEAEGLRTLHKEGLADGVWVLMDYGEVLVHVFYHEMRDFYALEKLWGDAPRKGYQHWK